MQTISFKNVFPLILFILLLSLLFNQFYLTGNVTFGDFFKVKSTFSNEVTAMNKELVALNKQYLSKNSFSEKNTSFKSLEQLALKRKALMLDLAKENPSEFLASVMSEKDRKKLPLEIQKEIEVEEILYSAYLSVIIEDNLDTLSDKEEYFISSNLTTYIFYPLSPPKDLSSGDILFVKGYSLDKIFLTNISPDSFKIISKSPLDSLGEQRILVIPVEFNNSGERPYTKEQIYNFVFNDSPFQKFYFEQSYGKIWFRGDVADWYTLDAPKEDSYPFNNFQGKVFSVLDNSPQNISNYSRIIFIVPDLYPRGGLSTLGKIIYYSEGGIRYNLSYSIVLGPDLNTVRSSDSSKFHWNWFYNLLSHEIGHTLGLSHAKFSNCPLLNSSLNCLSAEYGDLYDSMGSGSSRTSLHFNGLYKSKLGWILPEEVLLINSSGAYNLSFLESGKGYYFAKIPLNNGGFISLERRLAYGYDQGLENYNVSQTQQGLFIHYLDSKNLSSVLLDAHPQYNFENWSKDLFFVTLNKDEFFTEPVYNIQIGPVTKVTKDTIFFNVFFGIPNSSCSLVPVTGPCKAAFTKYYYDTSSNSCKSFIWGGCGVFPFDTLDTCTAQCVNTSQSPVKVNPPVVANTSVCYWSPDPRVRADPSQARSYVSQNLYGYPGSTDSRLLCDQGTWYVTVDEWSYFKFDASRPWGYKLVSEGTRIGNWTIQNARWVLTKTIEQPSIPKPLLKSCVWPPEPNAAVIGHANSSELLYLSGIAAPYTDARVLCYDGFWYTPVNEWPYFVYENRQTGFVDTPKASWGIRVVKPTETLGGFRVVNDSFWKLRWVK